MDKDDKRKPLGSKRELSYPIIKFRITVDIPCLKLAYLHVRFKIKEDISEIGKSEHFTTDSDNTIVELNRDFEVIHYVGADERQCLVIDILDNDILQVSKGYLYGSVSIKLKDLQKSVLNVPIYRDDHILGYLTLRNTVGEKREEVDIESDQMTKFLRHEKPSREQLKKDRPTVQYDLIEYKMSLESDKIFILPPEMKRRKGRYIFVRFCLKGSKETILSSDLKIFAESERLVDKQCACKIFDIRFTENEITKGKAGFDEDTLLVMQVFCGAEYPNEDEIEPELLSYAIIKAKKFVELLRQTDTYTFRRPIKKNPKFNYKRHIQDKKKKKKESGDESKNDIIDELLNEISGKVDEDDIEDNDETDEDLDLTEGFYKDYDFEFKSVNEQLNSAKLSKKDSFKDEYGIPKDAKIKFKVSKSITQIDTAPGDEFYEEQITRDLQVATDDWIQSMDIPFQHACDTQSYMLKRSLDTIKFGIDGWEFCPIFMVDLEMSCMQHLNRNLRDRQQLVREESGKDSKSKKSSNKKTTTEMEGCNVSRVIDAFRTIYDIIHPYTKDGSVRAYACGGVIPPHPGGKMVTKKEATSGRGWSVDGSEKGDEEMTLVGYPSHGFPRHVGFPLCQEYLLNNLGRLQTYKLFANKKTDDLLKKIDKHGHLRNYLDLTDTTKSWGGQYYVDQAIYKGHENIMKGFLEAVVLYQPLLIHPTSKYFKEDLPYDEDRQVLQRTTSILEDGTTMASSKEGRMNSTRFFTSYVDSGLRQDNNSKLFWDKITPHRHLLHGAPYIAYDVETVFLLLHEEPPHEKACNFVVWIISKAPSHKMFGNIEKVLEYQYNSKRNVALLIVLAAEYRVDIREDDVASLMMVAQPFQRFITFYEARMYELEMAAKDKNNGRNLGNVSRYTPKAFKKQIRRPRIKLCHWLSFSEVLSKAYILGANFRKREILGMDLTQSTQAKIINGVLSDNSTHSEVNAVTSTVPSYQLVREVLEDYLTADATTRVLGKAPPVREQKACSATSTTEKFSLSGMFARKRRDSGENIPTSNSSKNRAIMEEKALLDDPKDKIHDYADLSAIKKRFDEEYTLYMLQEIREFVSFFLEECHKEREDRLHKDWAFMNNVFCGLAPPRKVNVPGESSHQNGNDSGCTIS